jgi:hypothetical protein
MNSVQAAAPRAPQVKSANPLENVLEETVSRLGIEEVLRATEARATMTSVVEHAKIGFKSKYLPKHIENEDQAIAIALAGHELGIPPMTAFRAIYFFDGRIVLSSQLLVVLARRRVPGFNIDFVKTNETGCWLLVSRPGMTEPAKIAFTIDDAARAGLTGKNNWKNYPAAMCIARACAMGVHAVAPEAGVGVGVHEEVVDGVRYEVELGPNGAVDVGGPAKAPVDALKGDLAARQAERAAPPPGFDSKDPTPPAGFPTPKGKKAQAAKPGVPTAAPKDAPSNVKEKPEAKPMLPDPAKGTVGDTYENEQGTYKLTADPMGVVHWELVVANTDPEPMEPGSNG